MSILLDNVGVVEGFENTEFPQSGTRNSFLVPAKLTNLEGNDLFGVGVGFGLEDSSICPFANFGEDFVAWESLIDHKMREENNEFY